jgi:hypothetical protein
MPMDFDRKFVSFTLGMLYLVTISMTLSHKKTSIHIEALKIIFLFNYY